MMTEKERLKHSVETQNVATSSTSISPAVVALKQTLADVSTIVSWVPEFY